MSLRRLYETALMLLLALAGCSGGPKEPKPEQMELWAPAEREQLRRDVDALKRRIDAIPDEIEREAETIRRRYSDPDARLFPVAVTFLVPQSMT